MRYENYLKFIIESGENYQFEGLEINNKTSDTFHVFIKKLEEEVIDVENSHPANCFCSDCLG